MTATTKGVFGLYDVCDSNVSLFVVIRNFGLASSVTFLGEISSEDFTYCVSKCTWNVSLPAMWICPSLSSGLEQEMNRIAMIKSLIIYIVSCSQCFVSAHNKKSQDFSWDSLKRVVSLFLFTSTNHVVSRVNDVIVSTSSCKHIAHMIRVIVSCDSNRTNISANTVSVYWFYLLGIAKLLSWAWSFYFCHFEWFLSSL